MAQGQYEERRPRRRSRRRRRSSGGIILLGLLAAVVILAGAGYFYYTGEVNGSSSRPKTAQVEIPQGAGTAEIAALLKEADAVGNDLIFRFYSKYVAKADGSYQYGSFTLSPRDEIGRAHV